jgi:hypothetical protein
MDGVVFYFFHEMSQTFKLICHSTYLLVILIELVVELISTGN